MFPHHGIKHLCYPVYQNSSYERYATPSNAGICSMNLDCAISVFWTRPEKLLPACLYRSQKIKKLFTIRSRLHKLFKLPNNLIWYLKLAFHFILFYFLRKLGVRLNSGHCYTQFSFFLFKFHMSTRENAAYFWVGGTHKEFLVGPGRLQTVTSTTGDGNGKGMAVSRQVIYTQEGEGCQLLP